MVRRSRTVVGLVIGAVLAAIVVLTVTSISSAATFYYTTDQFRALPPAKQAAFVQVEGKLAGRIRWNPGTVRLGFTLDGQRPGTKPLPVVYTGAKPSPFKDGMSVVVAGRLGAGGVFQASRLMIKCPSKYTPKPGT